MTKSNLYIPESGMTECWKNIIGYEGRYEVSDFGRVRNFKTGRILKQDRTKGYLRVTLSLMNTQKRFQVHRLVALHFIHNESLKPCVNHKDGNKENNFYHNLEWCTHSENEKHSYDTLGKVGNNRKLSKDAVIDIRENLIKGVNTEVFMAKYSVCRKTILNVKNNKYYV